jgi:hypothetical protein
MEKKDNLNLKFCLAIKQKLLPYHAGIALGWVPALNRIEARQSFIWKWSIPGCQDDLPNAQK